MRSSGTDSSLSVASVLAISNFRSLQSQEFHLLAHSANLHFSAQDGVLIRPDHHSMHFHLNLFHLTLSCASSFLDHIGHLMVPNRQNYRIKYMCSTLAWPILYYKV